MAARTRLLERVALLSQEKLNQPERALKAYERILATDPRNRGAALALLPLYRTAQKWPRLLATYEALLGPGATGEGVGLAERLELFTEARRICEQRLGSKALAFQWCARAFEAAPKNDAVRTDLERLAGEADEWGALAALYDARIGASTDAEERLWLLRRALRIASTRLFRPQEARRAAEQILAEVGYDEEADAALEQILTQTKAWARSGEAAARARRSRPRRGRAGPPAGEDRAARGGAGRRISRPPRPPGPPCSRRSRPTSGRCARSCACPRRGRTGRASSRRCAGISATRAPEASDEREGLLLRIAGIQETRLADRDGDVRVVPRGPAGQSARLGGGGGARAAARGRATPIGRSSPA